MTKMPEELNAGFGLPKPSIHAAAHYSAFLTRYAQKQVDPAEAKALSDAATLIEILGQEVQPSIIEQIAQQWDGCNFDPMGETIDIGDAIRCAGKRLQTEALSQPQAEQQGAGYAIRAEFETWLAPIWSREGQVDADGDFVYNDEWVQGAWIGYQAALAALAALAARQLAATERKEDGWIDVSERKPEHAQEVLFVLDGKTVAGAWIGGIFWYSNQKRAALWWQPFPKPRIGAATHPQPAAPDSQPVGDDGQPMVLVSREFKIQAEHDTQIASDVANLLRDNKFGLRGSQPEMVAALLKIARQPVGHVPPSATATTPFAWATHHDEPMLFLTFAEAAAYCDDDERPIALFTAAPAAVPVDVQREVDSLLSIWQSHFDSGVRPDEEDEPEGAALWDRIASVRRAMTSHPEPAAAKDGA